MRDVSMDGHSPTTGGYSEDDLNLLDKTLLHMYVKTNAY